MDYETAIKTLARVHQKSPYDVLVTVSDTIGFIYKARDFEIIFDDLMKEIILLNG